MGGEEEWERAEERGLHQKMSLHARSDSDFSRSSLNFISLCLNTNNSQMVLYSY